MDTTTATKTKKKSVERTFDQRAMANTNDFQVRNEKKSESLTLEKKGIGDDGNVEQLRLTCACGMEDSKSSPPPPRQTLHV